jgi:hypothetical protein
MINWAGLGRNGNQGYCDDSRGASLNLRTEPPEFESGELPTRSVLEVPILFPANFTNLFLYHAVYYGKCLATYYSICTRLHGVT